MYLRRLQGRSLKMAD